MVKPEVSQEAHRPVALVGHRSAGKTQLAEILLHATGVVRAAGRVDDGTVLLDGDREAQTGRMGRMGSGPGFAWMPWKGVTVQLIDTPGSPAVAWPARVAWLGADLTVLVVSAYDGIERGAEAVLREARNDERPLVVVLNKVDRQPQLASRLEEIVKVGKRPVACLQLPLVEDGVVVGLIDLVERQALRWQDGVMSRGPVPETLSDTGRAAMESAREQLMEVVASTDEVLLEAYLEYLELTAAQLRAGLVAAARDGQLVPVLLASATHGIGAEPILDAMAEVGPDPAEWRAPDVGGGRPNLVAQWLGTLQGEEDELVAVLRVWQGVIPANGVLRNVRTGESVKMHKLYRIRGPRRALAQHPGPGAVVAVWEAVAGQPGDLFTDGLRVELGHPAPPAPMCHVWLRTERAADAVKLEAALKRLRLRDPSLVVEEELAAGGLRLGGAHASQIQLAVDRLKELFGATLIVGPPPIRYRERPRAPVQGAHGLYSRSADGLVAEFGEVFLDVTPIPLEKGFVYEAEVDEDTLPRRFLAAIGEGVRRGLSQGPLAGYPVLGVHARCVGGEYDALESTEAHFEVAGERAVRKALEQAGTELFEPWSDVRLHIPAELAGAVLSDVRSHHGRVLGLEVDLDETELHASYPDRAVVDLAARLESLAGGRAWFQARPSHYERLPADRVNEAVAASPFRRGAEAGCRRS